MSLLSKLTLVIPTYNRQRYVLRNMRCWSGSDLTVQVLDGSEQPIPAEEMAGLTANVNYHHLPISIFDRLRKAGDLVQTKYTALLSDDEFFLPDALQACIQELEADETFVSCIGQVLGFRHFSNQVINWGSAGMADYAVLQDDPIARMIHHMNPYAPSTIYSVVRTPVWKQAMTILPQKNQFSVYALGEIEFELAVCYQGKSKGIENLMWLRSRENAHLGDGNNVIFHEWWADKDKLADREEFLTIMASTLTDGDIGRLESVREGVRAACNEYSKFSFDAYRINLRTVVRAAVATRLPTAVIVPIRKILAKRRGANSKSLLQAAKDLEATGVHVNFEQLSRIVELVRQFHETPTDYQKVSVAQ